MKKYLLSVTFILTFIAYMGYQNLQPKTTLSNTLAYTATSKAASNSGYKDGIYIGSVISSYYGNVQVQATISSGQITNVKFLQFPSDRSQSASINSIAGPQLVSEAISAQSANVDIVSGATQLSNAFVSSLSSALSQA